MKKALFSVMAVAAMLTACNGSAPKAELKNDIDSLSYAVGLGNTRGLKPYLQANLGVDTANEKEMANFLKGVIEGYSAADDKSKAAFMAGVQIGQQIRQQMLPGLNYQLTGNDSTKMVNEKDLLAGFIAAANGKDMKMTQEDADAYVRTKMQEINERNMEKEFGPNRKAGEDYMKKIAAKEGIKTLGDGIYYEVLKEGNGAVPADSSMVKVNYEGKLIDGTVFDSSYKRNEPAKFRCNQLIPGWTKALTHMPVGSKWLIYIPQEQGYGARNAGNIKPFSALTFTVELLGIEK